MFDITNNFMVKKIRDIRFLYLVKIIELGWFPFLNFALKFKHSTPMR